MNATVAPTPRQRKHSAIAQSWSARFAQRSRTKFRRLIPAADKAGK
jgi:hypothetical protein